MEYKSSRQFSIDHDLYASKGQRFANLLIDYVCQLFLMMALLFVIAIVCILLGSDAIAERMQHTTRIEEYAITIAVHLIYYNFFELLFSRTIGKFITQTVVVTAEGEKPSSQQILMRSLCRLIPFDALSFLGAPDKGWHDSISKTYVVKNALLHERKRASSSLGQIGQTAED
ncbi:MAG TPA: RDD family protein [Flavobacterium sp.]|nr:RDD family protein [Flavobacterium sp.]